MKKSLITALLITLIASSVNAYTILANTNDLRRYDLRDEKGQMHFEWLAKIKADGLNKTHSEHSFAQTFSIAEKQLMYQYLGTDFVLQEECTFGYDRYQAAVDYETGFVDAYMTYNECRNGAFMRRAHEIDKYDIDEICPKYDTVAAPEQLEYTSSKLEEEGYSIPNYIILVRAYSGDQERVSNSMITHPQVGGMMFEIGGPMPDKVDSSNIDRMIRKVVGEMGKQVFILITPHPDYFEKPYEVLAAGFIKNLRKYIGTELLNNSNLFLIVSNYGHIRKAWFGPTDSVEAVTNELKNHPEWNGDDYEPTVFKDREAKHNGTGCFINSLTK